MTEDALNSLNRLLTAAILKPALNMTWDLFEIQIKVLGLGYSDGWCCQAALLYCVSLISQILFLMPLARLCLCKVENGNPTQL